MYERDAVALVDSFVGYAVAALPLNPGSHDVSASVFVANDRNARNLQAMRDYFTAARPELEGWRAQMLHRAADQPRLRIVGMNAQELGHTKPPASRTAVHTAAAHGTPANVRRQPVTAILDV